MPTTQTLDGVDLTESLKGNPIPSRTQPMIWDFAGYGGIVAVRDGDWKIIRRSVNRKKPTPWELYNLVNDQNETNDLASTNPEIVKRLESSYETNRTIEPDFPNKVYDARAGSN